MQESFEDHNMSSVLNSTNPNADHQMTFQTIDSMNGFVTSFINQNEAMNTVVPHETI